MKSHPFSFPETLTGCFNVVISQAVEPPHTTLEEERNENTDPDGATGLCYLPGR